MVDRPSAVAPSTPTSTTGVQDDVAAAADVSTVNGTTGAPEDLQKAVSQVTYCRCLQTASMLLPWQRQWDWCL